MKSFEIKAIIFDNGGVVLKCANEEFRRDIIKNLGISREEYMEKLVPLFHKIDRGFITRKQFWISTFKKLNRKFDPSSLNLLYTAHKKYFKVNQQVFSLAKKLKSKYIVAMLSNTLADHAKASYEKGIYKHFSPCILSHQVRMRKPNKNIYRYTVKKLKLKPQECVFIDDLKRNMPAPKSIGINTILFRNYTQLKKDLKKLGVTL